MRKSAGAAFAVLLIGLTAGRAFAQEKPAAVLADVIRRWADVVEPRPGTPGQTFATKITVTKSDGLPRALNQATLELAVQAPDHLRVNAVVEGQHFAAGRDAQRMWLHMPDKRLAILGEPGVPRFKRFPDERDNLTVPPIALPVSRLKLSLVPLMVVTTIEPPAEINGVRCEVLKLVPQPQTARLLGVDASTARATLWVRHGDRMPVRVAFTDGKSIDAQLDFADATPPSTWALTHNADDKVERVAVGHLVRFLNVFPKLGKQDIPTLSNAVTGARRVLATERAGRLEEIDGTKVLFLKGSPEEMGRQHGVLLKRQIHDVSDRILYGIGVGSSISKGNWFFGEIENAQARLEPFTDPRHLAEMDALAKAAGLHVQEGRLSNFFPELFHCSGFAIFGKATKDGRMYHGRVLDYMKGVGLEQNAVVIVHQPDDGHTWVNLSYAGFVGSVTAMNAKGIAIGEMGGDGYGHWDGKPMAGLMREVMEKADTLGEAIEIMRKGPRTCAYYYVISDGNAKDAVGIAATPETFTVVRPGESTPRLPHAVENAVLLSAGERYETLAQRVKSGYGTFDAEAAIKLMTRPVCMTSNIQSVLFAPETLDLWVANADGQNVASHTRFTHYNLKELLAIGEFQGKYRFLSNFWPATVEFEGITYPSAEHAYQSAKTMDRSERERIAKIADPAEAKKAGRALKLRDDWEQAKFEVMERCVRDKFTRNAELRQKLLATGGAELIEGNTWGDRVWGVYQGQGENRLGKILMKVRDELR